MKQARAKHGTPGMYTNHHCRCESCRKAKRIYDRSRKSRVQHLRGNLIVKGHQPRSIYTPGGRKTSIPRFPLSPIDEEFPVGSQEEPE